MVSQCGSSTTTASVVVSLPVISALPVSGNQDKDKLSLRSPEHHLSVNLVRAYSGVPSQLPSLRPDARLGEAGNVMMPQGF